LYVIGGILELYVYMFINRKLCKGI
jgi:hypothetical protein